MWPRAPSPMSRKTAALETVPVTGGHCKLQWKPDLGMRWAALGVDYEMYGKDHLAQAPLYDAICRIAGGEPPEQFMYRAVPGRQGPEDFQIQGQRHHHRRMADLWPAESLALFMFQKPRAAKRLYFDVIPKAVDEYIAFLDAYHATETSERSGWKIRSGTSMAARCRTNAIRSASRCCSIWSAPRTRTIATCCGASSAPMRRDASPESQSGPGPAGGLCAALLRGFREAGETLSRGGRQGTRGAGRSGRRSWRSWATSATARWCRMWSTKSARRMASSRCAPGSRRSTKCCSARPRARASAPSPPCSAAPRPRPLIRQALDGEFLDMKAALLALLLARMPPADNQRAVRALCPGPLRGGDAAGRGRRHRRRASPSRRARRWRTR